MKTLLCSQKPPLPLHFPKPSLSLYNPTQPILYRTTTTTTTATWKIQANAKGFGGGGATTKESVTKNNSNNNKKDQEDQLPQAVLDRIIVRILVSFGVPMATGFASLFLLGLAKEQLLWDVPKWVVGLTTLLTFGSSAVGIAYGPLSASWNEKRKGSLLGLEEAKRNWVVVWEEEEEEDDGNR
ncbi:hypothetical protein Ddye_013844 [Dipteronia dyeriana]|uniref:Uncharacterized protein n=1 Tax=Dipteronia dyeriana TaxID=168575 RepID=A0AAD9X756_9ROSI|nr:hypothetical protein Ddye_013844 [Dipteronia dyeriana]